MFSHFHFLFLLFLYFSSIAIFSKPDSVSKKIHFSPQLQTDPRQSYLHAKSCLQPSGLLRTSKMLMVRQLALLNRFFSSLLVPFLSTRLIFLNIVK
ncbi:hypothetical protein ES288_D10G223700v1 [Gossypium darwinii]|uniref:Uncharacterized protein n=1 Tax=Gossypium darwinii TaxID=34276 RepID=A0A5D2B374_GOSDA|nr:hypothetical protein ES288_D10G223700v1 [Gossypium darwinii]